MAPGMAELALIIIKAGTKLVDMLQRVQNNHRDAHSIEELIQLVNDVCFDMQSVNTNNAQMERDSRMLSAGKSLMEALQEAERQVCAYLKTNAALRALNVDGMAKRLLVLRRDITDRMTVLTLAVCKDTNEKVREINSRLKKLDSSLMPSRNKDEQAAGSSSSAGMGRQPRVWNQTDVHAWQMEARDDVSRALSLPLGLGIATILLRHYDWMPHRVKEEWRQRRDRFCRDVGLQWPSGASKPDVILPKQNQFCCNDSCPRAVAGSERVTSAGCSHYYCDVCWRGYISEAVRGGRKRCLSLRCPDGSCGAAVLWALVEQVADAPDKVKIADYLNRSPVDDSGGRIKWCPAGRSCGRAIEFSGGAAARGKDLVVVCHCGFRFCWSCGDRPHRALSCDMARLWVDTIEYRRGKDETQTAKASGAYRRWKDCRASLDKAAEEMEGLKSSSSALRALADQVRADIAEFGFVTKAYEGIMACRRLIRWVYVYEYYHQGKCQQLRDRRNKADDMIKHLEGKAMGYRATIAHATSQEFAAFKSDVIKLTRDAQHMVEKLVEAAETS